jgi:hypothetical protein
VVPSKDGGGSARKPKNQTKKLKRLIMRRTRLLFCLFTILSLLTFPAFSEVEFRFLKREKLSRELNKWVGKKVTITDRVAMIYKAGPEGYLMFDTHYFRCAIPAGAEGVDYIKDVFKTMKTNFKDLREELKKAKTESERNTISKKIYKRWKKKCIVTIYAEVKRPEFWGKVDDGAKGSAVVSERIVLVCEKAEKPRARWYKEIK